MKDKLPFLKNAFTLLTFKQTRFVCVPCEGAFGFIDQHGFHYGSFKTREEFKAWLVRNGLRGSRIGMANLEIINRRPIPPEVIEHLLARSTRGYCGGCEMNHLWLVPAAVLATALYLFLYRRYIEPKIK